MERTAWTDERLDDLSGRMDEGFARVDEDIRALRNEVREQGVELRNEVHAQGGELRDEMRGMRAELRAEIAGLRGTTEGLQATMLRVGGGMMVGLVGVIAAILARGV